MRFVFISLQLNIGHPWGIGPQHIVFGQKAPGLEPRDLSRFAHWICLSTRLPPPFYPSMAGCNGVLTGMSAITLSGVTSLPATSCAAWIAIAARLLNAAVTRSAVAASNPLKPLAGPARSE